MNKTNKSKKSHPHFKRRSVKDYFKILGPGVITGAADNDPSGIVTYLAVGALTGLSQLWLMFVTIPMLIVVEEMSARVGVVTKKGLNKVLLSEFGVKITFLATLVLVVCNVFTIGADIAAVAEVTGLLFGIKNYIWFIIPIALLLGYILLSRGYRFISKFLLFLTPVFLVYIINAFLSKPDWLLVIKSTLIPSFSFNNPLFMVAAVGLLGTTISPYLIFWQTTEEVEIKKTVSELKDERVDVATGMILCNVVFYFIIISGAKALGGQSIENASMAAESLQYLSSGWATILFSIGIIGAGLIAIPVLAASTGYALANFMHWQDGLDKDIAKARGFYKIIILSLFIGVFISLVGIPPMKMLLYSQVLNGILTPILLVMLLIVTNSEKIMGKHTNGFWTNLIGILTIFLMVSFVILMFWQFLFR